MEEVFDPLGECLTPEVARKLVAFRGSLRLQARMEELAEKCSDAALTSEERAVYGYYVRAINFLGVLQAKARLILAADSPR